MSSPGSTGLPKLFAQPKSSRPEESEIGFASQMYGTNIAKLSAIRTSSPSRRTVAVGIHKATCGSVTSPIRSNGGTDAVMRSITPKVAITWLLSG